MNDPHIVSYDVTCAYCALAEQVVSLHTHVALKKLRVHAAVHLVWLREWEAVARPHRKSFAQASHHAQLRYAMPLSAQKTTNTNPG